MRSMRLQGYDYSSNGVYFVTICVQDRAALFGSIRSDDRVVDPNDAGRMCDRWWNELTRTFPSVELDTHVTMPDHFHGLVAIGCNRSIENAPALSRVVQWFKTMSTAEYLRGVRDHGWPRVLRRLWQRGFYDHIVRSDAELQDIRFYIETNPIALLERWKARGGHAGPPLQVGSSARRPPSSSL